MHDRNHHDRLSRLNSLSSLALPARPAEAQEMISRFMIQTPTVSSVNLILPAGTSGFDLLVAAHRHAHARFGTDLIDEDLLAEWRMCPRFTEALSFARRVEIEIETDPLVARPVTEHERLLEPRGLAVAPLRETALGFAAYWIATSADLFGGIGVQTADRGLLLNDEGLVELDLYRSRSVAVVRRKKTANSPFSLN